MSHEHRWIDVSALQDASEIRRCVECGLEQKRAFGTDEWATTCQRLRDGTVIEVEDGQLTFEKRD